jgi:hypothetical protein
MTRKTVATLALAAGLLLPAPAPADVKVNINIGPPPIVLPSPPQLVVVPGSAVYYAPDVEANLFVYRGRYYSFHDGVWFYATSHRGPWAVIEIGRVPPPVVAVPVKYYRVPPGHAKKKDHGGGPGHFCPPGQAKKGRC